jgi:hypothetical protein
MVRDGNKEQRTGWIKGPSMIRSEQPREDEEVDRGDLDRISRLPTVIR